MVENERKQKRNDNNININRKTINTMNINRMAKAIGK